MKKGLELIFVSIISIAATAVCMNNIQHEDISYGCNDPVCTCSTEDITNMYADYVDQWKKEIANAFDEAQTKILNITPTPDIVGPDEDPDKCICKGTGVITHGDGHKTKCPYHGGKTSLFNAEIEQNGVVIYNK